MRIIDELAKYEDKSIKSGSSSKQGIVLDIETETVDNNNFRKVLYTGEHSQLVLMSVDTDIGEEVHETIDQFFRIDAGEGIVVISGVEHDIKNGSAFIIPAGTKHNIINKGKAPLKLYSIYSPPNHKDGTIHKTKEDASKSKEKFDGESSE